MLEIFAKKVSKKIVVYGILIPTYKKIKVTLLAATLFRIPRFATTPNNGRTIIVIGIPIADTKLVWIILFPINVYLARTYAAGAQIRISRKHDIREYNIEFIKNVATPPDPHACT